MSRFESLFFLQFIWAEFAQIQKVIGKWEGTLVRSAQEDIPITLEYRLISNESAIVERAFLRWT